MNEYNISKNRMMILSLIVILLRKQEHKKMEIVRLIVLTSLLLDRKIKEGYKTRTNFEYFFRKEEKNFSKYRIYYNIQNNLKNYQEKIYNAIDLGNRSGIIKVKYDSYNENLLVELINDELKNIPKSQLPETYKIIKDVNVNN